MACAKPTLHLLCGKICAGKSTLALHLSQAPRTVLISEDYWLSSLFRAELKSVDDYIRCSQLLRNAMGDHIVGLLKSGISVVLDFPANTVLQRQWAREILTAANVHHLLHYLDIPDEICRARLRNRNALGTHEFSPSEAVFDELLEYFSPPANDEGFVVVVHASAEQ